VIVGEGLRLTLVDEAPRELRMMSIDVHRGVLFVLGALCVCGCNLLAFGVA